MSNAMLSAKSTVGSRESGAVRRWAAWMRSDAAGGFLLFASALTALAIANSPWADHYASFWKAEVGFRIGGYEFAHSLKHLINDGLMAIFFFVIGLEVKREFVVGELRQRSRAALPIAAALGGMAVPALLYLMVASAGGYARGWGVPMATDIAFVVGCLALSGPQTPRGLRAFLLSLAIVDDLGAVLVIALAYTSQMNFIWLSVGVAGMAAVWIASRSGVRAITFYAVLGAGVWFAFHESGVHATLAGVLLGWMTPVRPLLGPQRASQMLEEASRGWRDNAAPGVADVRRLRLTVREAVSPLNYLLGVLHPWSVLVIMPVFALANAGAPLASDNATHPAAMGVFIGLLLGKPLGVFLSSWIAVRLGWAQLPAETNWRSILAAGCLAGIGFTMSLFIATLALTEPALGAAKTGVLAASVASALIGMALLRAAPPKPNPSDAPMG